MNVPDLGEITFDIAFGGSFFAIVKDSELGIEISRENVEHNVPIAVKFLLHVVENIKVQHPLLPDIDEIELLEIYGAPKSADADAQNMVVHKGGLVDRSTCGTGTCAKMATLREKGALGIGEVFVYESILETKFEGEILSETKVGEYDAIVPQITGRAFITGLNNLLIDDEDPVKYGFCLKK